jgi:hypothetical protein
LDSHRFGAMSRAPEIKYMMKVLTYTGKMLSDWFKWWKYRQKSIKNDPYPAAPIFWNTLAYLK